MTLIGKIRNSEGVARDVAADAANYAAAYMAVEAQIVDGETLLSIRQP